MPKRTSIFYALKFLIFVFTFFGFKYLCVLIIIFKVYFNF